MPRDRIRTGRGEIAWETVLKTGSLAGLAYEGKWEAAGNTLRVDATGTGVWLSVTERPVADFELKASLSVVESGNASIFFRQQTGAPRYYQFDLNARLQAAVVGRVNGDAAKPTVISAVNFDLTPAFRYDVELAVRGESITTYVNGHLVNQVRDAEYREGHVCLTAWNSKPEFSDLRFRVY